MGVDGKRRVESGKKKKFHDFLLFILIVKFPRFKSSVVYRQVV